MTGPETGVETTAHRRQHTVGIVEDHALIVLGFEASLAAAPDLTFSGHAAGVDELLDRCCPDVVVLDLLLADGTAPEANIEKLHLGGARVLVYTGSFDTDPYLPRQAARAGVWGIVPKTVSGDDLVQAVRDTAEGRPVVTTEWAAAIDGDPDFNDVGLSPQQREVLALYASGETTSRVAELAGLAPKTVESYIERIKSKYAVQGRPAETKLHMYQRAVEDGFLQAPRRHRWQR
ncbi:response regulator transcription factor [Tsukamurella asaccharolytica]|uniref:Response regulator transcription factor n=1 Tax=Tsukamurella asaccharolytica TaxID=2592067 RepID=A0A5C5RCH9_9ACTN|nr:response regulator transcription factor [Tsukamurella asaccharolytica]TWS20398.1 response regulator transcription factor [Tsukamurella asaccharolytica]